MAITNATIYNDVWNEVRTIINDNITDLNIYSSMPEKNAHFPAIVINPIEVSKTPGSMGNTGRTKLKTVLCIMELYTKSAQDLDTYMGLLDNAFETNNIDGLHNPVFESGSSDELEIAKQTIHMKPLSITWVRV